MRTLQASSTEGAPARERTLRDGVGLRLARALPLALFACSCLGTSTGNPVADNGTAPDLGGTPTSNTGEGGSLGGIQCAQATKQTVVESLDEDPGVGFSASDILAFAEGTHEEPLHWNPQELATIGPESGDGSITITVQHSDGEVRYVQEDPDAASTGDEIGNLLPEGECRPWLELDVEVTVKTGGGVLDEHFDATLVSNNKLLATLFVHPEPDKLSGSLAVTDVKVAGFVLAQLDLSISFTPFGVSGALGGVFEMRTNDAVSAAPGGRGGPFAQWGKARCDGGGFAVAQDDDVNGATAADVLALVAAVPTVQLTWNDGALTDADLAFEPEDDGACVLLDASVDGGTALLMRGSLTLSSNDGRVDGSWPGTLQGSADAAGQVTAVMFELDSTGALPQVTADNLESAYGVTMIETAGYDGFSFNLQLMVAASAGASDAPSVTGELALRGFVQAPCAQPEPTPDPVPDPNDPGTTPPGTSSGGSAGCRGADFTDLLVGTIE